MPRKFNYTGRRKIRQGDAAIELVTVAGRLAFEARLTLDGYDLPSDAQVWVEAYRKASRMHFFFGTCGKREVPADRVLTEFGSADDVQFRVRVTASGDDHGKLLAVADRIKPEALESSDDYTTSLLGITTGDLAGRIWAVDFTDTGPLLVLDKSIDLDRRQEVAGSNEFMSLVLPAVFQEVLMHILRSEDFDDEDEAAWQNKWLDFVQRIPGTAPRPDDADDEDELREWVADCSSAFARSIESLRRFQLLDGEGER